MLVPRVTEGTSAFCLTSPPAAHQFGHASGPDLLHQLGRDGVLNNPVRRGGWSAGGGGVPSVGALHTPPPGVLMATGWSSINTSSGLTPMNAAPYTSGFSRRAGLALGLTDMVAPPSAKSRLPTQAPTAPLWGPSPESLLATRRRPFCLMLPVGQLL
jgi:hypothetical protein